LGKTKPKYRNLLEQDDVDAEIKDREKVDELMREYARSKMLPHLNPDPDSSTTQAQRDMFDRTMYWM
jgi:hypothetical protein